MTLKGQYPISVCTGTTCCVRGAERVANGFKKLLGFKIGETTLDGKFSLGYLRCVGVCGLAMVVLIGEKVKDILKEYE